MRLIQPLAPETSTPWAHAGKWSSKLSRTSEAYDLSTLPTSADWKGALKPSPSVRGASDYVTVVQALLELEQLFGARATVWDDYYLPDPTAPSEIDIAALSERIREEYGDADSGEAGPLEQELEESEEESPGDERPGEDDYQQHLLTQLKPKLEQARAPSLRASRWPAASPARVEPRSLKKVTALSLPWRRADVFSIISKVASPPKIACALRAFVSLPGGDAVNLSVVLRLHILAVSNAPPTCISPHHPAPRMLADS